LVCRETTIICFLHGYHYIATVFEVREDSIGLITARLHSPLVGLNINVIWLLFAPWKIGRRRRVFIKPPLLFIEGCHGLFCHEFSLDPPGTDFSIEWAYDMWKMRPRWTNLWSVDHVGRLTRKGGRLAQFLAWTLLGGPPCYVCGPWLVSRRFGSSCGLVDLRERTWFVEKVLLWSVECVSQLMKCVFSLNSHAYKYLPTFMEMVSNKPLLLGWCSHFIYLCRSWRPKFGT
jgi:hypothetical protein